VTHQEIDGIKYGNVNTSAAMNPNSSNDVPRLVSSSRLEPEFILPAFIHQVCTNVPEFQYQQEMVGEAMLAQLDPESKGARLARKIYRSSGIDTRFSVIHDLGGGPGERLFFDESGRFLSPSTKVRNDLYTTKARHLFSKTAQDLLDGSEEYEAKDVTHVITVSCTGFFAPGPDYYVVKDLGLNPSTQRFHIGFMGCYAAFPALKMAQAFCLSDPEAVVLVVCLELCSLHLEPSEDIDDIIATSVFADGVSGALVSSRQPEPGSTSLEIDCFASTVAPDSEGDMAWTIGDHGFDMVLSTYVPRILEANVAAIVDELLGSNHLSRSDVQHWAIHPGGRAILDKVEEGLKLDPDALSPSRRVLGRYGNMSSATILFVIREMLNSDRVLPENRLYAMAFGPGLTVESALFKRV